MSAKIIPFPKKPAALPEPEPADELERELFDIFRQVDALNASVKQTSREIEALLRTL